MDTRSNGSINMEYLPAKMDVWLVLLALLAGVHGSGCFTNGVAGLNWPRSRIGFPVCGNLPYRRCGAGARVGIFPSRALRTVV